MEPTTIDLTPVGMQTPEGNARVKDALDTFQGATAAYANAASQFLKQHRAALGSSIPREDHAELVAALAEIEELDHQRLDAQEEFLRAVCGRPPAPFKYARERESARD